MFVSTIVTGTGVSLGVFVWLRLARVEMPSSLGELHTLHHTAERIENRLRGEVLRGNQVDKVLLAVFLLKLVSVTAPRDLGSIMTYLLEDAVNSRVGVLEGRSEKLQQTSAFQFHHIVHPLYAAIPSAAHLG